MWGGTRPVKTGWWRTLAPLRPWRNCRTSQHSTWLSAEWVPKAVVIDTLALSSNPLCISGSQLEVLHLLSPVQKAELLMRPEVASLDNDTLTFIFHDLLTGGSHPKPTAFPGGSHNWTTLPYLPTHHPPTTHDPYLPSSPHSGLRVREVKMNEGFNLKDSKSEENTLKNMIWFDLFCFFNRL